MRGAKSAKWVAGAAFIALAATACGGGKDGGSGSDDASQKWDPNGIVTMASGEPQNPLQPANVMESYGSDVIKSVFAQLVDYDESGKIVMENAESVTTTDSKTFTVKLKDGWTFHDGTPVTAKSYVDAWNWDAATKNNQQNASWFSDIKGYADVHPEKGAPKAETMSGLKVVDDKTFTIELSTTLPYFEYKLAYTVFSPLPESFYKDPKAAGEAPIGNGAYKFVKWEHKKSIEVAKYDKYKGDNAAQNGGVIFKNYTTPEASYADLRSDKLDVVDQIPTASLPNFQQDLGDRAVNKPFSAITTIGIAYYSKQWKDVDPKVIQGLSMAIDRATITKTVLNGLRTPATGWVAKGVLGYQDGAAGDITTFDPAKAKALIKEGGGVPGNKISIQYNTDGGHKDWVDAVCNSIRQATGVDCVGDAKVDFQADLKARDAKQVKSIYRSGWVLDYPVNANFLRDLYGTGAAGNQGGYSNKDFDALTKKADAAKTLDESVKLYQDAEKSLVNSMPSIPLWYYNVNGGHSNNVSTVEFGQDGSPIYNTIKVKATK
ncbi:peptide ABC transporter substrate-binding protein [Streptomyces sp. NBC_01217]|uniref:peptide ABC transporter substrate-binding protein n=1 Tax=Streptomyces sp. NBC_01217 TaxID=2903779 RepID=UPI002E146723|nr:ABC transporter substrate-binding protein [Streptomyces sp. NBC_01217]